jgi:hypothetical protein
MSNRPDVMIQFPLGPDAAWRRYLDRIRRADEEGYERAEQEAWEELQAALRPADRDPAPAA